MELILSSFNVNCLKVALDKAPQYKRALLLDSGAYLPSSQMTVEQSIIMAKKLQCVFINPEQKSLNEYSIKKITASGFSIASYTVDDSLRAKKLEDWGVQFIFTNDPSRMQRELSALRRDVNIV